MTKKRIVIIAIFLLLLALIAYIIYGRILWSPNVKINSGKSKEIFISTGSSFDDVMRTLKDSSLLISESSFRTLAGFMNYNKEEVPAGRYVLTHDLSNHNLITKLRSGDQDAQNVVINNLRTIYNLAGKASRYFESDSIDFLNYLTDSAVCQQYGFVPENFLTMFIPNTYKMFWTATPEKFVVRMKKEYDNFWTQEKVAKIEAKNITKTEAYVIASIVEKESNYDPERPTIAGVYLNRLKAGEKLQADPTVVFATGDFNLQRVLYSHLETDSPYNTYKYAGLPPGPICMPSISSLNAVIDSENHDYMFFCAKADNSGIHVFAKDYAEHQRNAAAFAHWLNSLNIK
ncbi:MAG: endolytic transglycosylase MltG [Saprospiraceae bacterium]|jgi:UPF0755 protein|nr:endolytic transglycosylase MltG [Saprospiraceae bacterium]